MRTLIVLTGLVCVVGISSVEANDNHDYQHAYHYYHPERDNSYHAHDCTRSSGYIYNYNIIHSARVSPPRQPVDVFDTIGSHIVGMTTFLQKRLSDITTAVHRHLPKR